MARVRAARQRTLPVTTQAWLSAWSLISVGAAVPDVEPPNLHAVAEFATGAGALMLGSGAAAANVVEAMLNVAQAFGIQDVSIDVTYSGLIFSYGPRESAPYTRIRTIQSRTLNYGRLTDVTHLVELTCQRRLSLSDAAAELRKIGASTGPYPTWLTRLAVGVAAGSAALIFGGDWVVILAAFLANVALDFLFVVLSRHHWPSFFLQAFSGLVAVLAAVVVHMVDPAADSSRVVISVIIVMLAGMTSMGGVQDAITGWYLTALARIFEAVMNTVGLIAGILFGLLVAGRLHVALAVSANVSMGGLTLPITLLATAVAATGFSVATQNPRRVILPSALLSAIGFATYTAAATGLGSIWARAAAAVVIGGVAVVFAQWLRAPAAAFAVAAILPLLPGIFLYQGLLEMPQSLDGLIGALGTALALAGGLMFGEYLAAVAWRQLRVVEDRFFTPLFAAPSATRPQVSSRLPEEKPAPD